MVLKTILAQALLTISLLFTSTAVAPATPVDMPVSGVAMEVLTIVMPDKVPPIAPLPKPPKPRNVFQYATGVFLDKFKLEGRCNVSITEELEAALADFNGPEDVTITSLRRNWKGGHLHNHGKAVDMEMRHDIIEWLVSADGILWLEKHNLMFYIEGRPDSKKLSRYQNDPVYRQYVLVNPNARGRTGDHIHIGIKK